MPSSPGLAQRGRRNRRSPSTRRQTIPPQFSILQPIFNYSLPDKWLIGASEMNVTYDWDKGLWANLPLGLKVSKLKKFDKLPVQFSVSYEYNFADDVVAPEWLVNLTVKFLFPI